MPTTKDLLDFADLLRTPPCPLNWPIPYNAFCAALEQNIPDFPRAIAEASTTTHKHEVVDHIYPVDDGYVAIRFQRELQRVYGLDYVGIHVVVPKDVVVRKWVTKPLDFTA